MKIAATTFWRTSACKAICRNWRQPSAAWKTFNLRLAIYDLRFCFQFARTAQIAYRKSKMIIGLLQLNSTIGDFAANRKKLLAGYEQAVALGAEFVLAPELFLCGYPPRDLLQRADFVDANLAALEETAKSVGAIPLCVGFVDRNLEKPGRVLKNSAAVLQSGKVIWRTTKSLLPTYDVFDEDRYFEPAKSVAPFAFNGRKLGITICEDIWNDQDFWPDRLYRRDPVKELIAQGAEIILNISASPWHDGKERTRLEMLRRVARDEKIPLAQVNLTGANDELIFDGHSVALNAAGEPLAFGKGFAEDVLVADLELGGASVPASRLVRSLAPPEEFPSREAQIFSALSLGIRDYVHKCGFKSVILGLSGGIDSALVAVLASDALGAENVFGVAMPARYSSSGSLADAGTLAKNLGIRYEVLPIEPAFLAVEKQLENVFAGTKVNEAEENVQSRLRGVTLMALSNKFGALVLTTGNKSEMAVGYCTLYGDMNGALAPIADVFKTDIYKIARWVNREREIIPADSITKPPSAELRPNQTDQDSLPPYETLDAILELYVVKNLGKEEIIRRGFDAAVVNDVVNKINFSEYKRRQAAPGLKVSPRAFGMGRRIPIAQKFRTKV
ncbi:MAG: NAD+ synthase [Verrucomicrobiales bacterium]|nr:NAD+ synthase [Verrucomicrobiales bacterium]